MSRIGKRPIAIPSGVNVVHTGQTLSVKGPKGQMNLEVNPLVKLEVANGQILVIADLTDPKSKAQMGTANSVVSNMVMGVHQGFTRKLILNGVGYRAAVTGSKLELNLGYSKPVVYELPAGVGANVENNTQLTLSSHDKVLLGQTAAKIRSFRKPEPYQGKGVAYSDETIRRKAGKTGKK